MTRWTVVKTYGINTLKHFMAYKGALMVNDDELYNSFRRCAELGALPLVHAENGDVVARMQQNLLARGITGPEGHAYSHSPEVEGEAANRAIIIVDIAGCPLYIVHVSCEQTHEGIRSAKQAGRRVRGEPLIQFLVLDESEYQSKDWDYAAGRVMSPPFRPKKHQDSLWAGLQSGTLSAVATDHRSFTIKQKRIGAKDFTRIPNGTGGLEDRMPVLWTAASIWEGSPRRSSSPRPRPMSRASSISIREGCRVGRLRCRYRGVGSQKATKKIAATSRCRASNTMCSKVSPAPASRALSSHAGESPGRKATCAPHPATAISWRASPMHRFMSPIRSGRARRGLRESSQRVEVTP